MPGLKKVRVLGSLKAWKMPMNGKWLAIFWMSGLIQVPPTHLFCVTARTGLRMALPIFIWRAPISIAAGSIPRCCKAVAPTGAHRIAGC